MLAWINARTSFLARYFDYKIFIIHGITSGGMALDLENENIHSR